MATIVCSEECTTPVSPAPLRRSGAWHCSGCLFLQWRQCPCVWVVRWTFSRGACSGALQGLGHTHTHALRYMSIAQVWHLQLSRECHTEKVAFLRIIQSQQGWQGRNLMSSILKLAKLAFWHCKRPGNVLKHCCWQAAFKKMENCLRILVWNGIAHNDVSCYIFIHAYIHKYIHVCVCVCVCGLACVWTRS